MADGARRALACALAAPSHARVRPPRALPPTLPPSQVRLGAYELPAERWECVSDAAKHLLSRMMRVDPAERITVTSRHRHGTSRHVTDARDAEGAEG